MATYDTGVFRGGSAANGASTTDPLVPQPVAMQVIEELPKASAMFSLVPQLNRVPMAAGTLRQPVLSALPTVYWLNGDAGLKQTATQQWSNVNLVAEELAALVPVPNAYFDDSGIPIWDQVRPRLVEAIGYAFDAACLFGVNKPASWTSTDVYTNATAAGNTTAGTGDPGVGVADLGIALSKDGYSLNGFASAPGFSWNLVGYRNAQGNAIYQPNLSDAPGGKLYGQQFIDIENGSWDATKASLIAGDWRKVMLGIRQDITFSLHEDGIISDDTGKVVYNAMQQDSTILRVVFRGAYALANPVTRLNQNAATRSPFAVLGPIAALS